LARGAGFAIESPPCHMGLESLLKRWNYSGLQMN
jgi:hypothetical protein